MPYSRADEIICCDAFFERRKSRTIRKVDICSKNVESFLSLRHPFTPTFCTNPFKNVYTLFDYIKFHFSLGFRTSRPDSCEFSCGGFEALPSPIILRVNQTFILCAEDWVWYSNSIFVLIYISAQLKVFCKPIKVPV